MTELEFNILRRHTWVFVLLDARQSPVLIAVDRVGPPHDSQKVSATPPTDVLARAVEVAAGLRNPPS